MFTKISLPVSRPGSLPGDRALSSIKHGGTKVVACTSTAAKNILDALQLHGTQHTEPATYGHAPERPLSTPLKNSTLNHEQTKLDSEKVKTNDRLLELQKTLAELRSQHPSPSHAEVSQCFLHSLSREKQNTEKSATGRVYDAVIAEEHEVQSTQILKAEDFRVRDEFNQQKIPYEKLSYYSRRAEDDFSPLARTLGEIDFLKHKLAIIDYSQKVNNLYLSAEWSPTAETQQTLQNHQAESNNTLDELDQEKLYQAMQLIKDRSLAKLILARDAGAKYTIKYFPAYTVTVYPFMRKKLNANLEHSRQALDKIDDSLRELCKTTKIKSKHIDSAIARRLSEHTSGEEKLNKQLALYKEIPVVTSTRNIDPTSGLYHEKQFAGSGTCYLHANNHMLASWHAEKKKPFIAFTPKRLELMVNGMVQQKMTKLNHSLVFDIKNGGASHAQQIFKSQDRGLKSILSKYSEYSKNIVSDYNFDCNESSDIDDNQSIKPLTTKIKTGHLKRTGIMDFITNNIIEDRQTEKCHSPAEWRQHNDILKKMEVEHSQLYFEYNQKSSHSAHAMCFTKMENQWYLQDSHFDAPVPCTPSDMIAHLLHLDAENSALSRAPLYSKPVLFREHHQIEDDVKIYFGHWS